MKSLLCLGMLLAFSWTSYAQSQSNENENKKAYMYCEIVGTSKFMSNKVTVALDFGQFNKFGSNQRLRDEEGKPIVFNSMVDAMNWMGADGWLSLIHISTITSPFLNCAARKSANMLNSVSSL